MYGTLHGIAIYHRLIDITQTNLAALHRETRRAPQWERLPNQPCRLPNHIQKRLWAGDTGSMALAFSHDGTRLAAGCSSKDAFPVCVYTILPRRESTTAWGGAGKDEIGQIGRLEGAFVRHLNIIYELAWSHDDKMLLSCSADGAVYAWNAESMANAPLMVSSQASWEHFIMFYSSRLSIRALCTASSSALIRLWRTALPRADTTASCASITQGKIRKSRPIYRYKQVLV